MKTIRSLSLIIFPVIFTLALANCSSSANEEDSETDPTADATETPAETDPVVELTCDSGDETDCDSDGTLHSCDEDDYDSANTSVKEACDDDQDGFVDIFCAQYADTDGDLVISEAERTAYGVNCDVCPDDYDPYQDDTDTDGYGDACDGADTDEDGYLLTDGDCDDADATIYPTATEVADDGIDQDCDGSDQITLPDDQSETTTAATDLTITIDSLTETANLGDTLTVNYTVTNNSDADAASDFLVEIRIHDTATNSMKAIASKTISTQTPQSGSFLPQGVEQGPILDKSGLLSFSSFCSDSHPCTTLESNPISLLTGLSESYSTTVTPATSTTGSYYFVVRVMDATGATYYARDAEIVKFE